MNVRLWSCAVLCALPWMPLHAASVDGAELGKCRRILDLSSRLVCYDKLADSAASAPAAAAALPAPPPVAAAPAPVAAAAPAPAPAPSIRPAPIVPEAAPVVKERKGIVLERVSTNAAGKLLLVTRDEGTWVQTDERRVNEPPAAGGTIDISRGALGSFFCQVNPHIAVRCAPRK